MTTTTYTVTVTATTTCPECNGTGSVTDYRWISLPENWSNEEIEAHFKWLGYDIPPDHDVPCYECDGAGYTTRQVTLREALAEIGVSF